MPGKIFWCRSTISREVRYLRRLTTVALHFGDVPMSHRDDSPVSLFKILRNLHQKETGIVPRIFVSIISGLLLTAAAFLGGFVIAMALGVGRVDDDFLAMTFAVCSFVWLALLIWIWRDNHQSGFPLMAAFGTLGLWLATIFGCVFIDQAFRLVDEEYLIAALCRVSGALTLLFWLPAVQRLRLGRPVVNSENLVNVTCPHCGYSLIGLRELRCPECGTQFAIDELIRRQNYGAGFLSGGRTSRSPLQQAVHPAETSGDSSRDQVLPKT